MVSEESQLYHRVISMIKRILRAVFFEDEFKRLDEALDVYRERNAQLEEEAKSARSIDLEFRCLMKYVHSPEEWSELMEKAEKAERLEAIESRVKSLKDAYLKDDVEKALKCLLDHPMHVDSDQLPGYLIAIKSIETRIKELHSERIKERDEAYERRIEFAREGLYHALKAQQSPLAGLGGSGLLGMYGR